MQIVFKGWDQRGYAILEFTFSDGGTLEVLFDYKMREIIYRKDTPRLMIVNLDITDEIINRCIDAVCFAFATTSLSTFKFYRFYLHSQYNVQKVFLVSGGWYEDARTAFSQSEHVRVPQADGTYQNYSFEGFEEPLDGLTTNRHHLIVELEY